MADKFYIGPYDQGSGQITNLKPFYIPDQAYERLDNAYVWRGRVRKRPGSRLIGNNMTSSRLRVAVGTLSSMMPISLPAGVDGAVGQMFSITDAVTGNTVLFTVNIPGTNVNMLVANGAATTKTFTTGASPTVNIAGVTSPFQLNPIDVTSTIYWYPNLPVMGLIQQEVSAVNNEPTIAFDTRYSYSYDTTTNGWERITGGSANAIWSGSDANYFQPANWFVGTDTALFVTNNNPSEAQGMRYLVGTTWSSFQPTYNSNTGDLILSAKFLVLFKNRLLALAPTIGSMAPGIFFGNRVAIPATGDPTASNAYNIFIPGQGTSLDAATNEQIMSYAFIKDRLIVFFERSTFELAFTGNQYYPFTWQKINTELGVESPNSVVEFDKYAIGVGNVGVHACNGSNVERIDENIPDFVFSIHNANNGVERVYGIRDFQNEMVYWAYPSDIDSSYCDAVLLYNYNNGTWAFAEDSIMCFGYFQVAPDNGITWDSDEVTWDDSVQWGSGSTIGQTKEVIAGNQQGYTFIFDYQMNRNAMALSITDLNYSASVVTITAINHNLEVDDWVMIDGVTPSTLNDINQKNLQITTVPDANTFTVTVPDAIFTGTYAGGGTIARINNITIITKQFNPYTQQGINIAFNQVDFLLDKTGTGETTLSFATSTSTSFDNDPANVPITIETFAYPDFYPYETQATQVWRTAYIDASGSYIQLKLEFTDEQMAKVVFDDFGGISGPTFEDFELHGFILSASRAGRLQ